MSADEQKKEAARAALAYVVAGKPLGVGTGSTVNHFIDLLASHDAAPSVTISSSKVSTERLESHGITVVPLDELIESGESIPVYVDGADEIDTSMAMIKGGGGAQTREKILAAASDQFVCIVDQSKQVDVLGKFPLPIEVIPMSVALVQRQLRELGANPVVRSGFTTDNGNPVLDVHGLSITDPRSLESQINQWPGVVTVGLFAHRGADVCLVATPDGVKKVLA
jgi:ribose 5-phosphate isomerase A